MAKLTATVVGMSVWAVCWTTIPAAAESVDRPRVLVRVYDYADLSAGALSEVQTRVGEVYARAGVDLEWVDGYSKIVATDTRVRVDVMVLDGEMADRFDPDPGNFGRAGRTNKRAYIYYQRVAAHVRTHGGTTARALALVLAHELGHTLLPEYSHSSKGLMTANWEGSLSRIPDFTPAEAETIRTVASIRR